MPQEFSSTESENSEQLARETVHGWLARFSPLVMKEPPADLRATRQLLQTAEKLHKELPEVTTQSTRLNAIDDHDLLSTFRMARSQISQIENDLRIRLGRFQPGDPQSRADLDALQERLAENAARIELGVSSQTDIPPILTETTSKQNFAAAAGLLIFALGWNGFTLFHAILMIGGMWTVAGPLALLLLLFYSIFFFAGFAMLNAAFQAAAKEEITLDGPLLTVTRTLGPVKKEKTHVINPKIPVTVQEVNQTFKQKNSSPTEGVVLTDMDGKPVSIALGATVGSRKDLAKRLNAYLQTYTR